jgi:hypothetical protein
MARGACRSLALASVLSAALFSLPLSAEPRSEAVEAWGEGTFLSYPSGANVTLLDASKNGSYLGLSGNPISVPREPKGSVTTFYYQLVHPDGNHQPLNVTVPAGHFSSSPRWPESGALTLAPNSPWVALTDLFRYPSWRTGLFALAFPVLGGLLWALYQVWLKRQLVSLGGNMGVSPYHGYYRLRRLGGGGNGNVYLAVPQSKPRASALVALKILEIPKDPHLRETLETSFPREVKAIQELNHPNIVAYHGSGRNGDEEFYLVMEYIKGSDLSHYVPAPGGKPSPYLLHHLKSLAGALQAVHDKNIIHRDLKPENVMLREDGFVKLTDFGLAREENKTSNFSRAHGSLQGTPGFYTPEQFSPGTKMTLASDQYTYGVLCSRLIAAHFPVELPDQDDPMGLVIYADNVRCGRTFPLVTVRPDLQRTSDVIERMMHPEPGKRYSSISEAYNAFEKAYLEDTLQPTGAAKK